MPAFVINIRDLGDTSEQLAFDIPLVWMREQLEATALTVHDSDPQGSIILNASRVSGTDILVQARVRTTLHCPCSRCLGDAALALDLELTTLFVPRAALSQSVDIDPEELDQSSYAGYELVLDQVIREHLLLAVPMKPLCDEACKGLATIDSKGEKVRDDEDFSIDPRLAPLRNIKGRLEN